MATDLLNNIINNPEKSCFKCLSFKIKPFKTNGKIEFRVSKEHAKCSLNKLNKNTLIINNINSCNNKDSVLLSSGLKSIKRYKKIALYCDSYNSD